MIGLPLMFPLTFLDELAPTFVDVDESSGTRLRRASKLMSSSCWGKRGGEGGEISRNGDRAVVATGRAAAGAAANAGTSGSSSIGKLE